jgi:hypothetical protein
MWRFPVAHPERMALATELSPPSSERRIERGAELSALGGPTAVMAVVDKSKVAVDDEAVADVEDEWSGGFDIHLGVYTND